MAALFLVISVLGLWEFYSLLEKGSTKPQKIYGVLFGIICFIVIGFIQVIENKFFLLLIIPLLFIPFIIELYKKSENPFLNIAATIIGVIYLVIPFTLLIVINCSIWFGEAFGNGVLAIENRMEPVRYKYFTLGYFFLIWSNDTFAYLVGRAIGKTKLFERISPKKTWEGFIGGIICTQGIAYLISIYFNELAPMHWHVVALIVSVFGTLGDLVESMFKRSVGVKDSGTILPGHGGILDRFDGVLLSSPFVVTYLMLVR